MNAQPRLCPNRACLPLPCKRGRVPHGTLALQVRTPRPWAQLSALRACPPSRAPQVCGLCAHQPPPVYQGYLFTLSGQSLGVRKRGQVEEIPSHFPWGEGLGPGCCWTDTGCCVVPEASQKGVLRSEPSSQGSREGSGRQCGHLGGNNTLPQEAELLGEPLSCSGRGSAAHQWDWSAKLFYIQISILPLQDSLPGQAFLSFTPTPGAIRKTAPFASPAQDLL